MSSSTDSTVILNGPDDWDNWDKLFKSKAVSYSLWEHINPKSATPKSFLREPEPPIPGDFMTNTVTPSQSSTSEGTNSQETSGSSFLSACLDCSHSSAQPIYD